MNTVTRLAPAKINLGLDIVGRRTDGYHLLETVFQAVSIYDTVTVTLTEEPEIVLTCDTSGVPSDARNIAWKAAQQYRKAAAMQTGIAIRIEKHIPMEAGMGGGSTDGAAVLLALQQLTDGALHEKTIHKIAVKLGADVPFFLYGGTVYAAGIGEQLERLPAFHAPYILIAKGTAGVSTADAYRAIDTQKATSHSPVQALRQAITKKKPFSEIAPLCGNLFETVVELPEITEIRRTMLEHDALCSVMTGSGAAVFGIFGERAAAEQACNILRKQNMFAKICHTLEGL